MRRNIRSFLAVTLAAVMTVSGLVTGVPWDTAYADVITIDDEFEDSNLCDYLRENVDQNGDGILSDTEIAAVTELDLSYLDIQSVSGIKIFYNLTTLSCNGNQITDLDMSGMKKLEDLMCYDNPLETLDITSCWNLTSLLCDPSREGERFDHWEDDRGNVYTELLPEDLDMTDIQCFTSYWTYAPKITIDLNGGTVYDVSEDQMRTGSFEVTFYGGWDIYCPFDGDDDRAYYRMQRREGMELDGWEVISGTNVGHIYSTSELFDEYIPEEDGEIRAIWSETPEEIEINDTNFPDDTFRSYVLSVIDTDGSLSLSMEERKAVERIDLANYTDTASIEGIRCFTELKELDVLKCKLQVLDLSSNTKLTSLVCSYNELTYLNVKNNHNLLHLLCEYNQLQELNLSGNPELQDLICGNNPLDYLDLSNCPELIALFCENDGLYELDLENNRKLVTLFCESNRLTELDLKNQTGLNYLSCPSNQISKLDVSVCRNLSYLYCYENELTSLDLSNNTKLVELNCHENLLSELDLQTNSLLTYLNCMRNRLKVLNTSGNPELENLLCYENSISELDISNNNKLKNLYCSNNRLSSLDVSNNPLLTYLSCSGNQIKYVDLRNMEEDTTAYIDEGSFLVRSDDGLGWRTVKAGTTDEKKYYVVDDGGTPKTSHLATGVVAIDGDEYYFDSTGALNTSVTLLKSIDVTPGNVSMTPWDTVQLTADPYPSTISTSELKWVSDDPSVATVDANGLVTGIAPGFTTITVSSVYGGSAMYSVPVRVQEVISFESAQVDMLEGEKTMIPLFRNTDMISGIGYVSRDRSVVTVNGSGELTAVGEGETSVVITVVGSNGKTATFFIWVYVAKNDLLDLTVDSIELLFASGPAPTGVSVMEDYETDLELRITTEDGDSYDYTYEDSTITTQKGRILVSWSSSNPQVASVTKGRVQARSEGMAIITVRIVGLAEMTQTFRITVLPRPVGLIALSIDAPKAVFDVGEEAFLTAVYSPSNTSYKDVYWESDDPDVAYVSEGGKLSARSVGETVIRLYSLKDNEIYAELNVQVDPVFVNYIVLGRGAKNGTLYLHQEAVQEGSTLKMLHNSNQTIYIRTLVNEEAEDKTLTARSDQTKVAAVTDVSDEFTGLSDNYRVYAIKGGDLGTANVTFSASDAGGKRSTLKVQVVPYNEWVSTSRGRMHYTGEKADVGLVRINGSYYYFGTDGIMRTGIQSIGGKRYMFGSDGVMLTGWQSAGGKRYLLDTNGVMQTGWRKVSGKWYYLAADGVMQTKWKKVGKSWYFFGTDGVMRTKWLKQGKTWYYLGTGGAMQTKWKKVGKAWYFFGTDGAMRSGWKKVGGKWYYFAGGAMKTGWLKSGKTWYYFNKDGEMVTGSVTLKGKQYRFDSSGACLNP